MSGEGKDERKENALKTSLDLLDGYLSRQDYVAGDWLSSKRNLSEALKIMPLDGPTRTLYRVLKSYEFRAPSDWRGYRALTSKT